MRVRLLVQPDATEPALKAAQEATRGPTEQGAVATATTAIAPEVEARLVSPTLAVVALDPDRQSVSAREPTEWRWDVTAKEGGAQQLALTLFAIPPEHASVRRIKSFERVIEVEVPVGRRVTGFLGANWDWLWTLVAAPLGGWALARRRARRERGEPPPPPE